MILGIYTGCAIFTFITLVIYIVISGKKVLFYNASFFIFSAVANLGYIALALSTSLEAALLAQKITYIGGCTLTMFLLFLACNLCEYNIPPLAALSMYMFNFFVFFLAMTPGYTDWFYKSAEIKYVDGVCLLIKNYAWGHILFNIMLYGYMFGTFLLVMYSVFTKRSIHKSDAVLIAFIGVSSLLIHVFSKQVVGPHDMTPVAYCIDNVVLLHITYRASLFNVEEAFMGSLEKQDKYGYILVDKWCRYLGSNDVVKHFLPEINEFVKDKIPGKNISEAVNKIMGWIKEYDGNDVKHTLRVGEAYYEVSVQYMYHKGFVKGYIVEVSDDTMQQNYIQMLNRASENKTIFLTNVSHEIRTPVNSVLGMNEMILREAKDPQILEYASNVQNSGNVLLQLINDILDLSRIESGKLDLQPEDYKLETAIRNLENMIKPLADSKDLIFEINVDPALPNALHGDINRIKQMVTNLLTNAVKYTDQGKVVFNVNGTVDDDIVELVFSVRDSGRGIKKSDIDNLFTAFERADEKNNSGIEGTGLGLAITKRFAELMGGEITVESEYGHGSVFTLTLTQKVTDRVNIGQYEAAAASSTAVDHDYKVQFTAPEAAILVVDDIKMNLMVIKALLKETKLKVDTCVNGVQAIESLKEKEYDLVLLDHMMPGMDGVDVLNELRKDHIADGTPIVALTANAVGNAREEYLALGFDDYISKPILPYDLEKKLIELLPEDKVNMA